MAVTFEDLQKKTYVCYFCNAQYENTKRLVQHQKAKGHENVSSAAKVIPQRLNFEAVESPSPPPPADTTTSSPQSASPFDVDVRTTRSRRKKRAQSEGSQPTPPSSDTKKTRSRNSSSSSSARSLFTDAQAESSDLSSSSSSSSSASSSSSHSQLADVQPYLNAVHIDVSGLAILQLSFGSRPLHCGEHFSKADSGALQTPPDVALPDDGHRYTLLYIDPDAPERHADPCRPGKAGPWLHWLVTGCVGSVSSGSERLPHNGPTPPKGVHRYIVLLARESAAHEPVVVGSVARKSWDIGGFVRSNAHLQWTAVTFFYVSAT